MPKEERVPGENTPALAGRREGRSPVVGPSKPRLLEVLGPGLISGAATDDPTAIATYAQAGARFGYGLCWVMPLVYPLMVVVQVISARLGRTTGRGLAGNIRRHQPAWLLHVCVGLLLLANIVAIAADLSVMADALRLLIGGPRLPYVLLIGAFCVVTQVFMQYTRYVAVLKWTTLSLLAYVVSVLLVEVPWAEVGRSIVLPPLRFERDYLAAIVAIFGVALSPYLYFWQASQEAEDQRVKPMREPLVEAPEQAPKAVQRIQLDTLVGMAVANLVGLAIMITTAATLHAQGMTEVRTSLDAAAALRPVAGPLAFAVFALGIIGTGLLAVPVLAGSAAYAIGEARRWPVGLARQPLEAKAFYGAVAVATLIGVGVNIVGLDPIRALYLSAILNGVIAVPVLAMMLRVASHPNAMGEHVIGRGLRIGGWVAVAVMAAGVAAMGVTGGIELLS
jgi:NRAMP (natural resistance-associated macrophage protein)-like metal ion transporter